MSFTRHARTAFFAFALLLFGAREAAAVTVTPAAVYIDHRVRNGTITLYNTGTTPENVVISFAFGYPKSDAAGEVSVALVDSAPEGEPSAVPWLRAFPRRLTLEPGARQVVRILAEPPASLGDGEYWARVVVTSSGPQPPVEQQGAERVSIALTMQTQIINPVIYRKGAVSTGVAVRAQAAAPAANGARLLLDLAREGNAAFLGRVRAQLVAPNGDVLAETEHYMAVYRELRVAVPLEVEGGRAVPPGSSVRFSIDNVRPDLPPDGPLPARPVEGSVRVGA
ncbi:MAG TPA: hypothetical protein VFQ45_18460 [Longimicrobium sp.]|nr:hypothetical protein [Longimicrobium sp.]